MVKYSKTTSRVGWRVNKPAIQAAIDELDIRNPVYIIVTLMPKNVGGEHAIDKDGNHMIRLNEYASVGSGTYALWHELAHAMQAERHMTDNAGAFIKSYMKQEQQGNYWTNEYEIEANKIAYEHQKAGFELLTR